MIRIIDIILSILGLFLSLPIFFLAFLTKSFSSNSPFFYQFRVGRNQKKFLLYKFRTMKLKTRSVATHLVEKKAITTFGSFLRYLKIDELPQLWNVLRGDMSLVGPRPSLLNQKILILERKKRKVFSVRPGLTGLSQIKGINMSQPILLAKTDYKMIKKMNIVYYFYYLLMTLLFIFKKRK
jgi:lipopolysaccharide/colanic/teichoic acid biosynthesis glycosyltransferase